MPKTMGVFAEEDYYRAECDCPWGMTNVETDQAAAELLRLHRGEDHCPDCGSLYTVVQFRFGVTKMCEPCEAWEAGQDTPPAESDGRAPEGSG